MDQITITAYSNPDSCRGEQILIDCLSEINQDSEKENLYEIYLREVKWDQFDDCQPEVDFRCLGIVSSLEEAKRWAKEEAQARRWIL